ncbi:MAG: hypothetical protein IKA63_04155 [Clostridia bacterium]|nr:hypothetical protein [Clostridia bacterium]
MKQITMIDTTLCREDSAFSFKERIEIARHLERLNIDVIELPEITDPKTDVLFVRTVSPFVKHATLSVAAGSTMDSIENAAASLTAAAHGCIRIELPVSPVGMEYTCHKKPDKMLQWIAAAVAAAKEMCHDVEFCAVDATRAEPEFLTAAIAAAVEAGATRVAVCDSAAMLLPDDFAAFAEAVAQQADVPVSVRCDDKNGMACAQAILAVRHGVDGIKTAVDGTTAPLETVAAVIKDCGDKYGFTAGISQTELNRVVRQIAWITDNAKNARNAVTVSATDNIGIHLDTNDGQAEVMAAVASLGYDLSEEDQARVYEEFLRVAGKKTVGAKELEAIVASSALQVPATYKLVSYVINNGNILAASAQLTLEKEGKPMQGVCLGDGPIDAAFLAIDHIIGHHYELDDFQIQSVTEGKEAMGSALVKLRSGGKLYAGNGISTDIIGASIRAYLNAVNKIVYEEA